MDINCDLGEGTGNDAKIMPFLTSCNIACGMHAGDRNTMRDTVRLAKRYGVKIGAHPSFPDRENFGRTEMQLPFDELKKVLTEQISELQVIARKEGVELHHVKPHGALYNMAVYNPETARAILESVQKISADLLLYVPYGSVIEMLSRKAKIPYFYEVFADRAYNEDLSLVSRKEKGAVLNDPEQIFNRVKKMIRKGKVETITGKEVPVKADTVCIHGDHKNAVQIVQKLATLIK